MADRTSGDRVARRESELGGYDGRGRGRGRIVTSDDPKFDALFKFTAKEWRVEMAADTEVDKFNLDDACATQGNVFAKWAGMAALAKEYMDTVGREMREISGEIDLDIRANPKAYGLKEVKENALKAIISMDKKMRKWSSMYNEAAHLYELMKRGVDACTDRKTMTRMLGDLWLGEYKGGVLELKREATEEGMRDRMMERRKKQRRPTYERT